MHRRQLPLGRRGGEVDPDFRARGYGGALRVKGTLLGSMTMAGKRRVFGAAFKAKVALAAARGDRTTAQLASQFGIHTSQVTA